jgi:ABC-type cobalamin/Fe3+-siderophores transport system ATPase subunit
MRLKRLWIDGFKNLNDFEINFENNNGKTVLIGNNGSGKSNILEAISAIFIGLYKLNTPQRKPNFEYKIEYELDEINYKLELKRVSNTLNYTFTKNSENIQVSQMKAQPSNYLPNLIMIYSGEETRLWDKYYNYSYSDFMRLIRSEIQTLPAPNLFYINRFYWNISLLTLLYSSLPNNIAFCKRILKFNNLDDIKIKVKFNQTNIRNFAQNAITSFINTLSENNDEKDYTLVNFKDVANVGSERELYLKLMASVMNKESRYKLIDSIEINFGDLTTEDLSEGEKKQILLRISLEVLADEKTLVLFDEPDSNIHVANKVQIKDMLEEYENRETILTTHSPTLMKNFDENLVYLEDGEIKGKEKAEILQEISGDTMSFAQQQIVLNSDNDILLVEGKFDIKFIKTAIEKINEEQYNILNNLEYIPTGGASGLRLFIDKFKAKDNQNIIAILDNDKAGQSEIKELLTDEYKRDLERNNYVKIQEFKNTFLLLLPKPERVNDSQYEIEDFFPLDKLSNIAIEQINTFKVLKNFTLKKDTVKRKLNEICTNDTFIKEDFKEFKKLFDLILEIKRLDNGNT